MQEYYHNTMLEAQKTGNKQLENWVKSERKKNNFDPESGKDLKKFHVGLDKGRVGDGLKPDEIVAKIKDGEIFTVTCTGANKGGLVAKLGSYDVFVPSSQIRIGFVKDLEKQNLFCYYIHCIWVWRSW